MSVVVPILETTFKTDLDECMSLLFENTQFLPEDKSLLRTPTKFNPNLLVKLKY